MAAPDTTKRSNFFHTATSPRYSMASCFGLVNNQSAIYQCHRRCRALRNHLCPLWDKSGHQVNGAENSSYPSRGHPLSQRACSRRRT